MPMVDVSVTENGLVVLQHALKYAHTEPDFATMQRLL